MPYVAIRWADVARGSLTMSRCFECVSRACGAQPRSIVVQDRTKYHVNASNSSANVMMGTRAYQQASAAAPDGFNRVLAEVRGLGSKMDAYQTSLQAVVANQVSGRSSSSSSRFTLS